MRLVVRPLPLLCIITSVASRHSIKDKPRRHGNHPPDFDRDISDLNGNAGCTHYCDETFITCTEERGEFNKDIFLDYGPEQGDTEGPICDDCFLGPIDMTVPYFGITYTSLFLGSNGIISFQRGVDDYTSETFPIVGTDRILLSAFWTDLDFEVHRFEIDSVLGSYSTLYDDTFSIYGEQAGPHNILVDNTWWWRRANNTDDLSIINDMIRPSAYPDAETFEAVDAMVVSYHKAFFYNQESFDRTNTFQQIVAHDTIGNSYTIFNFGDIEWVTGEASDGDPCSGTGGTPASSGFNDGISNHYSLPQSQTDAMLDIELGTNVGLRGRYIYKIDAGEIVVIEEEVIFEVGSGEIPTESEGITDAMKAFLESAEVSEHGCVCGGVHGQPIDIIDIVCKQWRLDRGCLLKQGGACFGGGRGNYTFDGGDCLETADTCAGASCAIDRKYADLVNDMVGGTFSATNITIPGVECHPLGRQHCTNNCCGLSPDVFSYSPIAGECVDNSFVPFGEL